MRPIHLPSVTLLLALTAPAVTAQIALRPLATVNVDSTANPANPEFVGSNPIAVAWDGNDLYVAGFNSSGSTNNTGIVRITGALGTPSFGAAFGVLSTPSLRGYSGLAIQGGQVAAAYDNGGASADGIAVYDNAGNQLWAKNARGGSGVAFDPGFPGGNPALGQGVAWATFGSGRRPLQDTATGADIWTTANGMVILTSEGTFWRDLDFDAATGDVYLREGNNVIRWVRNGDNSVTSSSIPFDPTDSDFVNGQNIAFCQVGGTQAVFFNDRSQTVGGQAFFDVVNVIAPDGTPLVVDWGGFTAPAGVGAYDFSYDAASGTLAICDFANRDVHLFAVEETCSTLGTSGSGLPGTTLTFTLSGADPNAPAGLVLAAGRGVTSLSLGSFGQLDLGLAQPLVFIAMGLTDASGSISLAAPIPTGTQLAELHSQAFSVTQAPSGVLGFCTSNVDVSSIGQ